MYPPQHHASVGIREPLTHPSQAYLPPLAMQLHAELFHVKRRVKHPVTLGRWFRQTPRPDIHLQRLVQQPRLRKLRIAFTPQGNEFILAVPVH